jgi:hypothetical protein
VITFTCPSCSGKCQVADAMSGRKMKCPSCGTRIRHHADGTIEVLTVGAPPPAPAAATTAATALVPQTAATAPVPAAPLPTTAKESSAVLAVVPDLANKLLSQGEAKQNTLLVWGLVGFLAVVLGGVGLILGSPILAVAPTAIAFVAAFAWLALRNRSRQAAYVRAGEESKTEPIAKV